MKPFVFLTSLVVSSAVMADQGSGQVLDLLNKMSHALKSLNYHGKVVYMHEGHVESLQLFHKNDEKGERQRVVHLNGTREVIRKGDTVTCYLPDSQSVVVGTRRFNNHLLAKLTKGIEKFADQYTFDIAGHGSVAGRDATIVSVVPNDVFRYGYRFWIDKDTKLLLRSELVGDDGQSLEQVAFVELEVVDNIPDKMLMPAVSGDSFTWHDGKDNSKTEALPSSWHISKMPNGFKITGRSKQRMPNSSQPVDYMIVSDGLASVSVYIEQFNAESQGFIGASRMGAVNIFGSVLDDHHVTVVGEVPRKTVQMIAESVSSGSALQ